MKTRFIGDIHGKIGEYLALTDSCEQSVQVGDFGYGFIDIPEIPPQHRFIRGNHDNPSLVKQSPNWIPDGTREGNILYIGGAWSIDQSYRIEGKSWWVDEQCSYEELDRFLTEAYSNPPQIVVSHDCPGLAVPYLFGKESIQTRTGQALSALWQMYKPKLWLHGHWHNDIVKEINGTRFICLNELSYIDIDLEKV